MKKIVCLILALCLLSAAAFAEGAITVYSREDGSGTRSAFIELFGVDQKNEAGEKVDYTTEEAVITSSTAVMLTGVAGDPAAIGYVSLGSLNDTVKALSIDGVAATVDNIKSGEYAIARPFNIATGAEPSALAQDFIAFILSSEGQAVIEANGAISAFADSAYRPPVASEMNVDPGYEGLPMILIMDGRLQTHNLSQTGKDEKWLRNLLSQQGAKPENVYLASLDTQGRMLMQKRDGGAEQFQALDPEKVVW